VQQNAKDQRPRISRAATPLRVEVLTLLFAISSRLAPARHVSLLSPFGHKVEITINGPLSRSALLPLRCLPAIPLPAPSLSPRQWEPLMSHKRRLLANSLEAASFELTTT